VRMRVRVRLLSLKIYSCFRERPREEPRLLRMRATAKGRNKEERKEGRKEGGGRVRAHQVYLCAAASRG